MNRYTPVLFISPKSQKMSKRSKQPCLDGFWIIESSYGNCLHIVKGSKSQWKYLFELEYPDFELSSNVGSWTYGTYKETPKDIEEKTGAANFNLEMKYNKTIHSLNQIFQLFWIFA